MIGKTEDPTEIAMPVDRTNPGVERSPWRRRTAGWLDSDLVGIPATLYTFAVLAVSLAVFRFGGPVAGIVVAVALWIPMVLFAIREVGQPTASLEFTDQNEGPRHRVLVVANQGLEDPALCREICRREERIPTEVLIVAPVIASSRLRDLTDDVDRELDLARNRVEAALQTLSDAGVEGRGRADISEQSTRCSTACGSSRRTRS